MKILNHETLTSLNCTFAQRVQLRRLIEKKDDRTVDLWNLHDTIVDHANNDTVDYPNALRVCAFIYEQFPLVRLKRNESFKATELIGLKLKDDAEGFVWCSIMLSDSKDRHETCIADESVEYLLDYLDKI